MGASEDLSVGASEDSSGSVVIDVSVVDPSVVGEVVIVPSSDSSSIDGVGGAERIILSKTFRRYVGDSVSVVVDVVGGWVTSPFSPLADELAGSLLSTSLTVGSCVAAFVLGASVGDCVVGARVGLSVVGVAVGSGVGFDVGRCVGLAVGRGVDLANGGGVARTFSTGKAHKDSALLNGTVPMPTKSDVGMVLMD